MSLVPYTKKLIHRDFLIQEELMAAFSAMFDGQANSMEVASFLTALSARGEQLDAIVLAAKALRERMVRITAPKGTIDSCGTGGDGLCSLNVSTAVAFVVAACGVPVAKHGNKAVSSSSGSADILSYLGIVVDVEPQVMEEALHKIGIGFLMAPRFHPAMRHVAPVRAAIKIRTIFNLLGPLINPACVSAQLLGVYDKSLVPLMAEALLQLGVDRAWVVHGGDGMDELTLTDISYVTELSNGGMKHFELAPEDAGLNRVEIASLKGGDVAHNAKEFIALLENRGAASYQDIVLLNSAALLLIAGDVSTIKEGVARAKEALSSGAACQIYEQLREHTQRWSG